MVQPFCHPKNLNLIRIILILILILLLFHFPPLSALHISTSMRVYPLPSKRNTRMMESFDSSMNGKALKKLRKLPHVFSKFIELPCRSDADVLVEDCSENIRFIAKIDVDGVDRVNEMKVRTVEIHPGVVKIVVRKDDPGDVDLLLEKLNIDTWRFRLPHSAQPDMASVVLIDEKLIVTVPKGDRREATPGQAIAGLFLFNRS